LDQGFYFERKTYNLSYKTGVARLFSSRAIFKNYLPRAALFNLLIIYVSRKNFGGYFLSFLNICENFFKYNDFFKLLRGPRASFWPCLAQNFKQFKKSPIKILQLIFFEVCYSKLILNFFEVCSFEVDHNSFLLYFQTSSVSCSFWPSSEVGSRSPYGVSGAEILSSSSIRRIPTEKSAEEQIMSNLFSLLGPRHTGHF
jgi:hypothetical protein